MVGYRKSPSGGRAGPHHSALYHGDRGGAGRAARLLADVGRLRSEAPGNSGQPGGRPVAGPLRRLRDRLRLQHGPLVGGGGGPLEVSQAPLRRGLRHGPGRCADARPRDPGVSNRHAGHPGRVAIDATRTADLPLRRHNGLRRLQEPHRRKLPDGLLRGGLGMSSRPPRPTLVAARRRRPARRIQPPVHGRRPDRPRHPLGAGLPADVPVEGDSADWPMAPHWPPAWRWPPTTSPTPSASEPTPPSARPTPTSTSEPTTSSPPSDAAWRSTGRASKSPPGILCSARARAASPPSSASCPRT